MQPDPRLPWWARARARLTLLTAVLAGTAALADTQLSGGTAHGGGCWIDEGPQAIELRAGAVAAAIPRLGLTHLAGPGRHELDGLTEPSAVFTDAPPHPRALTRDPARPVLAGYGSRWSPAPGETDEVTAFRFASKIDSGAYLAAATSPHCRPGVAQVAVAHGPADAYGVARRDPQGRAQSDVLFARGPTVFWVFVAQPSDRIALAARRARALACRLPAAGCH